MDVIVSLLNPDQRLRVSVSTVLTKSEWLASERRKDIPETLSAIANANSQANSLSSVPFLFLFLLSSSSFSSTSSLPPFFRALSHFSTFSHLFSRIRKRQICPYRDSRQTFLWLLDRRIIHFGVDFCKCSKATQRENQRSQNQKMATRLTKGYAVQIFQCREGKRVTSPFLKSPNLEFLIGSKRSVRKERKWRPQSRLHSVTKLNGVTHRIHTALTPVHPCGTPIQNLLNQSKPSQEVRNMFLNFHRLENPKKKTIHRHARRRGTHTHTHSLKLVLPLFLSFSLFVNCLPWPAVVKFRHFCKGESIQRRKPQTANPVGRHNQPSTLWRKDGAPFLTKNRRKVLPINLPVRPHLMTIHMSD